jgi:hypothetical protein
VTVALRGSAGSDPIGVRQIALLAIVTGALALTVPPILLPLGLAALAAGAALVARRDRLSAEHAAWTVFLLAVVLRSVTALLVRGYGILPEHYLSDAFGFESDALRQLAAWQDGSLIPIYLLERNRADSVAYRYLLGLFGLLPLWAVGWMWLGNVVVSALAGYVTALALLWLGRWTRGALLLAALAALAPTATVFGSMPVRDNVIFLGVALLLYSLAATHRSRAFRIGLGGAGTLLALALRAQFGACLVVGLGAAFTGRLTWTQLRRIVGPWTAGLGTALLGALAISGLGAAAVAVVQSQVPFVHLTPEALAFVRQSQAGTLVGGPGTGSGYLLGVTLHSWPQVAAFGVLAGLLFLIGPPLGLGAGPGGSLVGLEGGLWLALLLWSTPRLWRTRRHVPPAALSMAAVLVIGLGLFGIATADYGTAARLRLQFIPFILALTAMGLATPGPVRWPWLERLRVPLDRVGPRLR